MSSNIYLLKNCQQCNKTFTARTTVTKYCSSSCSKKAWKLRKRTEKIEYYKSNLNSDERLRVLNLNEFIDALKEIIKKLSLEVK